MGASAGKSADGAGTPRGFDAYELRLGDIMRGERATMGKSLLDIQRDLKIKAAFIAAIEGGDLDAFPTPGFIAGFVKSYARYLGLEAEWSYQKFCEETGFQGVHGVERRIDAATPTRASDIRFVHRARTPSDPLVNTRAPFAPPGSSVLEHLSLAAIGSSVVLLFLILGLGFGAWTVLQEIQRVQVTPIDTSLDVAAVNDPVRSTGAMQVSAVERTAEELGLTTRQARSLYRPGPDGDVPPIQSRDMPIAMLDPQTVGVLAPNEPGTQVPVTRSAVTPTLSGPVDVAALATPTQPAPEQDVLQADANGQIVVYAARPAWVQVTGPDGSVIFEKILDAEETAVFEDDGAEKMLRAGNSGAVFLKLNGELFGPIGTGNKVARDIRLAGAEIRDRFAPVANVASIRPRSRPNRLSQAEGN